jgi:DNA-binding SARP family transcriptional activator
MQNEAQSVPSSNWDHSSKENPQNVADLLHAMRTDFRRAKTQLQDVCRLFDERESLITDHLSSTSEVTALPSPSVQREYLWIHCLGSFEVSLASGKIDTWRSSKAKSLLKFMTSHRKGPFPRDVLIETLWPKAAPDLANNNLKAAIYALRQTLTPVHADRNDFSHILAQDGNYAINPDVQLWVDAEEFEHHWATGRSLEKEGETDRAAVEYAAAETLYRGDFLQDDPYEDWTLLRREALKDTYLAILGKLGDYFMMAEDYDSAIVYCQKIIAKDSCREDAYRRLMRCHGRLGQRNRALHWYRICERTIKTELDLPPDRRTAALHEQLVNDEPL